MQNQRIVTGYFSSEQSCESTLQDNIGRMEGDKHDKQTHINRLEENLWREFSLLQQVALSSVLNTSVLFHRGVALRFPGRKI